MIQTFIEKNKRLLQVYCVLARIVGWIILFFGVLGLSSLLIAICTAGRGGPITAEGPLGRLMLSWYALVVIGFISLGVAQFIKYLFDNKSRSGWLLRHGDKILYIFAFSVAWHTLTMVTGYFKMGDMTNPAVWLLNLAPMLLLNLAKILTLLGLAQILKRVLPTIEESRTLI
jgi:hypothetical protein